MLFRSVAPGTIVAIFGSDLASAPIAAQSTPLPTILGDTSVTFNGVLAPLFFVSPGQINAQVPWNLSPGEVAVRIRRSFLEIPSQSFQLAAISPGIFTANSSGTGLGAVLHADTFQPVTAASPTAPNRRIAVFMTGLGATNPPAVSGQPAPTPAPTTVSSLLANVAGIPAPIEFSVTKLTDILGAIRKRKGAPTIAFVVAILANVFRAIAKNSGALTMTFVVLPLADIFVAIGLNKSARAIMVKFRLVSRAGGQLALRN